MVKHRLFERVPSQPEITSPSEAEKTGQEVHGPLPERSLVEQQETTQEGFETPVDIAEITEFLLEIGDDHVNKRARTIARMLARRKD